MGMKREMVYVKHFNIKAQISEKQVGLEINNYLLQYDELNMQLNKSHFYANKWILMAKDPKLGPKSPWLK